MKEIEQLQKEHQELGNRIQELKDSLNKPKVFELGRWYRHNTKNNILMFKGTGIPSYGFLNSLYWIDSIHIAKQECFSPATEQEVKDALIKEAERRGYKEGVEIEHPFFTRVGFTDDGFTGFKNNCLTDFWYKGSCVMKDGQWATIIKDDVISIGGYKVKFHQKAKDGIWHSTTIDGYGFSYSFWQAAKEISEHSKAKVMIGCSKQFDVSLETINKILDKLK